MTGNWSGALGVRFEEWVFLPSIGRSGGILAMWDIRVVTMIECLLGEFTVSVKFKQKERDYWWLTVIVTIGD